MTEIKAINQIDLNMQHRQQDLVHKFAQVIEDIEKEISLEPPEGRNNAQIDEWFKRQQAIILFFVTSSGKKYFTKLADDVKKTLLKEQYITDDLEAGESDIVGEGFAFDVWCKVNNPSKRVNATQLVSELRKMGVDKELLDEAVENATKESNPSKIYTFGDK